MNNYKDKYLKYKQRYLYLKNMTSGGEKFTTPSKNIPTYWRTPSPSNTPFSSNRRITSSPTTMTGIWRTNSNDSIQSEQKSLDEPFKSFRNILEFDKILVKEGLSEINCDQYIKNDIKDIMIKGDFNKLRAILNTKLLELYMKNKSDPNSNDTDKILLENSRKIIKKCIQNAYDELDTNRKDNFEKKYEKLRSDLNNIHGNSSEKIVLYDKMKKEYTYTLEKKLNTVDIPENIKSLIENKRIEYLMEKYKDDISLNHNQSYYYKLGYEDGYSNKDFQSRFNKTESEDYIKGFNLGNFVLGYFDKYTNKNQKYKYTDTVTNNDKLKREPYYLGYNYQLNN